jgi:PAS domain-containing protein
MDRDQAGHTGAASGPFWAHAAWLEMTAALDWLPLAALVLAPDGTALTANEAWVTLFEAPAEAAHGDGWLRVVAPRDRGALRALLREVVPGETGCSDFRLVGPVGERWSRWWWLPGPAGRLIACVADLDERPPHDGQRHLSTPAHLAAYPPRLDQPAERPASVPGPILPMRRCTGCSAWA